MRKIETDINEKKENIDYLRKSALILTCCQTLSERRATRSEQVGASEVASLRTSWVLLELAPDFILDINHTKENARDCRTQECKEIILHNLPPLPRS